MSVIQTKNTLKDYLSNVGYFTVILAGVFGVTYFLLFIFNLTPGAKENRIADFDYATEYWLGTSDLIQITQTGQMGEPLTATRPDRIIIDKVGVNTIITNPNTRDVSVLDQNLSQGAVHYPGSGTIERGNMFIFGHSSGLANIRNQAYKAFNGIEKLNSGDQIKIIAEGKTYLYKVINVKLLNENEAMITFDNSARKLTLTTCNTFGSKQDRWVVEAVFDREL